MEKYNKDITKVAVLITSSCLFFGLWLSSIFAGLFLATAILAIIKILTLIQIIKKA